MKDFVKMTLAVICGLVIMGILVFILGFGMLGALLAAGSSTPVLPKSGVLVMDMSRFVIGEQSQESNPLSSFSGSGELQTIGIWDAVQAINSAATDPAVQYIYLKTDGSASGIASLEEIRKSLAKFRQTSGKPIVSYIEAPTTGGYYLASVADKIYMTSHIGGTVPLTGVSSQSVFLGDLLGRLGINVQLIKHGKYKSAGEMFTKSKSSPENREQYQRMVDSMWESMSESIAQSRELSVEALDDAINNLKLNLPQDFVECGLVDELLTKNELEDKLAVLAVKDSFDEVSLIPFADYVANLVPPFNAKQQIAIIYADGEIIDGSQKTAVAGDRFASIIADVRADSTVKAVVLRVNSPGGSVLASEKIKNELDLLQKDKPVVASYGEYAASGGYWISNGSNVIFTDATTLTGSIGVFGMIPDFSKTAKDVLHIGVESVNSHKHGDMFGLMRPFDQSEFNYMTRSIENIYDRFVGIVSDNRSLTRERVDEIAQGRVWTGADALPIELVDEIGTLEDAVNYAASIAGDPDLGNWSVCGYPSPQTMMEKVLEMFYGSSEESVLLGRLKDFTEAKVLARMDTQFEVR